MEQPRPLRRRRRSSRRGAGPPGGPTTPATPAGAGAGAAGPDVTQAGHGAAHGAEHAADQAVAGHSGAGVTGAGLPATGTATAVPVPADPAAGLLSQRAVPDRTAGEQPEPAAATAVANASFDSRTADDTAELEPPRPDTVGRDPAPGFAGSPGSAAAIGHAPEPGRPPGEGARRSSRTPRDDQSERSLRALVTTRSTQVPPPAAMRAREVAVPTAEDLLAAERDLVLVRRHYVPPTTLAAGRRRDRTERRPSGAGQTGSIPSTGSQPTGQPPA